MNARRVRFGFLLLLAAGLLTTSIAHAGGRVLDGRQAPELEMALGSGGFEGGARLSTFRGRPVFLMFWLKDCPHCARELPRVQRLHDQWGGLGLQVFTVVHRHRPAAVVARLSRDGYNFPVACDLDGSQARRYGVGARPAIYLIGVDGRVKTSNRAPDSVIAEELGRYRLARIGDVPATLKAVRDLVWQGRMGTALRTVEEAAKQKDAGADVKAFASRVLAVAKETLAGRRSWISKLQARRQVAQARREQQAVARAFVGTSLAAQAGSTTTGAAPKGS